MGKMAIKRWTRFRMAVLIFVVWLFAFGVFIGIFISQTDTIRRNMRMKEI